MLKYELCNKTIEAFQYNGLYNLEDYPDWFQKHIENGDIWFEDCMEMHNQSATEGDYVVLRDDGVIDFWTQYYFEQVFQLVD